MELYLFGVMHASPICRNRYVLNLDKIFRDNGAPAFVAVEASQRLFQEIIESQRAQFRDLATADEQFTGYGDIFVDTLAKCIGFEADAHAETYGKEGPPVLWLDEHRDHDVDEQGCVNSLGKNYYHWFKDYLDSEPCPTMQNAFMRIHDGIRRGENLIRTEMNYHRDARWAQLIDHWMQKCSPEDHSIVIVGLDHLGSNPKSILSRLTGVAKCERIDTTEIY